MAGGSYKWEKGNTVAQTDVASPTKIAERFNAIVLEPGSKFSIQVSQNYELKAYSRNPNGVNVVMGKCPIYLF